MTVLSETHVKSSASEPAMISEPSQDDVIIPAQPVRLSILGATGSVGTSTLDVVAKAPKGTFDVIALTANENVEALAAAAIKHDARYAAIANPQRYDDLVSALAGTNIDVGAGLSGLNEAVDRESDCVMAAIVGAAGLRPAMRAAKRTSRMALANKECLVIAGELFLRGMSDAGTELLPVDSEHAAIHQILEQRAPESVAKILLTASGGPFREYSAADLQHVTLEQALKHPNWSMGAKITIDSATLMNKGLELIEAHHLFGLPQDSFDALVHPQSIVHGVVEFCDGSAVAQMAAPDMRTPIAQSLFWPQRSNFMGQRFDFKALSQLTFEPVDEIRFPAFALARAAMAAGGGAPTVLNGANEIAVEAFLNGHIKFLDIATTVGETMEKGAACGLFDACSDIDAALNTDAEARRLARDVMVRLFN